MTAVPVETPTGSISTPQDLQTDAGEEKQEFHHKENFGRFENELQME